MLVHQHILISSAVGILGYFFFDISFIEFNLFIVGGTFMDIDHIFSYWYYQRKFSVKYAQIKQWCIEVGYLMNHFFLFHSIWFLVLLFFLQYKHSFLTPLFYGMVLHIVLDVLVDFYWYYFLKKNLRPYRRWVAPKSWLKKIGLEKIL